MMKPPRMADDRGMDVSAASFSAIKQGQVREEVDTAVAKKAMDVHKQQGAAALSLLESAAATASKPLTAPGVGGNLSVLG